MKQEFDDRRSRQYPFHREEVRALRFVKSWHCYPPLGAALWYRGVNLGELDEFELFADVLPEVVSDDEHGDT